MEKSWTSTMDVAGSHSDWQQRLTNSAASELSVPPGLETIRQKLVRGERLTLQDGIMLFEHPDLPAVTRLADLVKHSRFSDEVYFNSNLHVNQTNVCTLACRFCAFRRGKNSNGAYALTIEEYVARIEPWADNIDEVHSVGGLHPDWDIDYYVSLFTATKAAYPNLHIKALTAVEIKHVAEISSLSVKDTLLRLKHAGLDSLPGGGAEILDDGVRDIICRGKESSKEYLQIHAIAHEVGLPTNCTMLFGTVESIEHRVQHMIQLREQQDRSGGFQCFIAYPFLPDMTRLPEAQLATGVEILRTIAVGRLMLDNIPHIKAYRMNLGDYVAELALIGGADDIDGTVGHEEIMHAAGSTTALDDDRQHLASLIQDIGGVPVQRNTIYTRFRRFEDDEDRGSRPPISVLPMA